MIFKKIIIVSLMAIALTWISYWYNFGYLLDYEISNKTEDWGVLGDFLGGVLNPFLSFLTVFLLVNSLRLQKESNSHLKSEIERSEHFEKVRSFESNFFNMLDSQKVMFVNFHLNFKISGNNEIKYSSSAVIELESILIEMRELGGTTEQIKAAVEAFDQNDDIYSVVRTFCVIVKSVDKKLGDSEVFSAKERMDYYETLINFTDYSLMRLILICYKYLDYSVLQSLSNAEFMSVIKSVGAESYLSDV